LVAMGLGKIGARRNRAVEQLQSLLKASLVATQRCVVIEALGFRRVDGQSALVCGLGPWDIAEILKGRAQVCMGLDHGSVARNRGAQVLRCLGEVTKRALHYAEVIVRAYVLWIECERATIGGKRLFCFSGNEQGVRKICMSIRHLGIEADGVAET